MPELKPLPSTLNICGIDWTILQTEDRWNTLLALPEDKGVDNDDSGHADYDYLIISISPSCNLNRAWIVLTHEILHILEGFTQQNEKGAKANEKFIESIDEPLYVFLRDSLGFSLG